jgi:hypothetical protein
MINKECEIRDKIKSAREGMRNKKQKTLAAKG